MHTQIIIRELEEQDIEACVILFKETIHSINAKDYSSEQLDAWCPSGIKHTDRRWQTLLENISYVAEVDNQIVGFVDITKDGYLDRLFVHKDYQRKGIGLALLSKLEEKILELGILQITVEASITAKPLFEKLGYKILQQQQKAIQGVKLINFVMKKNIL